MTRWAYSFPVKVHTALSAVWYRTAAGQPDLQEGDCTSTW